ncbi:MAG: single-stranded-DNA-specific exonuclease RecJ, partial [Pseudomonadota bacterium]
MDGALSDTCFLGVARSATGRRWIGPTEALLRQAQKISQDTGLPDALARVLARAGVTSDAAEAYLAPSLRDTMPDPSTLRDMDRAVEVFLDAVDGQKTIAVFADYDVDGGASAAILTHWLGGLGMRATLYVPDRIDEGYGPNTPAMTRLAEAHDLILCVDCGTLSFEPVAAAKAIGARVVILDHHQGGETLPQADAVVNPNRQDEDGALGHLCAAAVVFLFLAAVNRALRARGTAGPDLLALLDLVALATVADVAPLLGFNRALVRQGLKVMGARARPGLTALSDVAKITGPPTAFHLGFLLGPRVNAGGRVGEADLGARLLASTDPGEAANLAGRLDQLNLARREIEAEVLEEAKAQAEARGVDGALVWAASEGWHPGVVGIVAARLKEAFNRPAIVIGLDESTGKGSGRSVAGVDLGAAIARATSEGTLLKGGGHKMAAGLTVARDQLEPAMSRLEALLARQGAGQAGPQDLACDGAISCAGASLDLVEQLEAAGPYGAGAPAPRLVLSSVTYRAAQSMGDSHMRLSLQDPSGRLDAVAFRVAHTELGAALDGYAGRVVHVAGRVEINEWGGRRTPRLRIEDIALA